MKKRLTLEQHKIVAAKLHEISDALVFLIPLVNNYPLADKVHKHMMKLDSTVMNLRSDMEARLFQDVPKEQASIDVYYHRTREEDEKPIHEGMAAAR